MKHNYSFFKLAFTIVTVFFSFFATAQSIRGKVTGSDTKEPMIGATVLLKETGKTQAVQLDGYFTFKNLTMHCQR